MVIQNCDWCNIPQEEKQWLLLESPYWSVYLADVQDYVGRCTFTLRHFTELPGTEVCVKLCKFS